ncbi:MAG: TolC family protein [Bacteroidaceae bacterium]|nr:TolC family protein [Bacteroidaceae bacterium]
MKRPFLRVLLLLPALLAHAVCGGQIIGPRTLTMQEVIQLAQENSISSMSNRNNFVASYWNYRSYKAQLLPSLSLSATLGDFRRSLDKLQDFSTGAVAYRTSYNMTNSATLNFSQNIPLTGGQVTLSTDIQRLDQYSPSRLTSYYAQPIYLSYAQSLWGYNQFKWEKKTQPKQYEVAKRQYIESMEQVNQTAASYFWGYVREKEKYERAKKSFEDSKRLFAAGQTRFEMGTITRDQLMQIEVSMLNDSLQLSLVSVSLRSSLNRLCSYIGYKEDTELNLQIDYDIPDVTLDYDDMLDRALHNSSFQLSQDIEYIEAESSIARAKSERGLSARLNARFGMSGSSEKFRDTFIELKDQEVIGVQLNIPILDWGLARGRVRMAEARAQTTRNRLEQNMIDYRQDLLTQVMQFNNQRSRCEISKRAADLAEESYELALKNFSSSSMTMTQLDQLKEKRDDALSNYVSNVADFWNFYFAIRRTTLYDPESGKDISVEFDNLIK